MRCILVYPACIQMHYGILMGYDRIHQNTNQNTTRHVYPHLDPLASGRYVPCGRYDRIHMQDTSGYTGYMPFSYPATFMHMHTHLRGLLVLGLDGS